MGKRENPVDHVLDRMVEAALGENAHFNSHAEALGIPAETIKTWRRRGEVPTGKLLAFAQDWKVSVDWLLHGDSVEPAAERHQVNQERAPYGEQLTPDEVSLIEGYRRSTPEVRAAALRVLAGSNARIQKPERIEIRESTLPERKPGAARRKKADAT